VKQLFFWLAVAAAITAAAGAGYRYYYLPRYGGAIGKYRTMAVHRGAVTQVVNSTGTVQPVLSVQIGSFVSGPVQKVFVDFNDHVKRDQILAQVDPRTYKCAVASATAGLLHSQADMVRVQALLDQARRDEKRAQQLHPANAISETDFDQCLANRKSLEAQLKLAEAMIQESQAALETAQTNLEFTDVKSPVDGIVTDRKIDPGQTVAAQFQTPVLFVVAPDLEKKVYVYASVDEADIGLIREAQRRNEPVLFTVDAYPKDVFRGAISQVRLNWTTVQNVVTYTVIVDSVNPGLKLLPGMTANLSFQIEKRADVMAVPNAALRFFPKPEQVRADDRSILETITPEGQSKQAAADPGATISARTSNRRYVWVLDGDLLAAVPIVAGLSDKSSTELLSGDLRDSQELVVGIQAAAAKGSSSAPPP
jgi:HlyD family secretion protein